MIFSKRKDSNFSKVNVVLPTTNVAIPIPENTDVPILENIHFPDSRKCWYHVNQRDDIRQAYIKNGPHQPRLEKYKQSG